MNVDCAVRSGLPRLVMAFLIAMTAAAPSTLAESYTSVSVNVKVFNYSRFDIRLSGAPERFTQPAAFEIAGTAAGAKGQQALLTKGITFIRSGRYAQDARIKLEVRFGTNFVSCYSVLAYGRGTEDKQVEKTYQQLALGTDQPRVGCAGGPEITWQTSQDDIEIVVDPQRKSWASGPGNDMAWICNGMTPQQRKEAAYCPK